MGSAGTPPLADSLAAVVGLIRRFVVLGDHDLTALALWTAHTHAADAATTTPYIGITSAEKRSGKTRLLEVLELVVRSPLPTANISDAALYRAIGALAPTLLFDEIDAIFGAKARDREDLRGMLNAGYRQGACVMRMGGARMTDLERFPVFCPKVFAGIGDLPDTIADRSIRIRLQRRTRAEPVERFRRREVVGDSEAIRTALEAAMSALHARLAGDRPSLPDELDDRAQDGWEALLAIADRAGRDWPERARAAAIALSGPTAREDQSLQTRLLSDLQAVFAESGVDRFKTADLVARLAAIEESPWGDYFGRWITAHQLSKLLQPFAIRTMPVYVDGITVRGYKREQFVEVWERVLDER